MTGWFRCPLCGATREAEADHQLRCHMHGSEVVQMELVADVETIQGLHAEYVEALRAAEVKRGAFMASVEGARGAGATNQRLGDVLGVSRQRVSQLLKKS